MTSSQSALTERLRQKLETERQEIEITATRELQRLGGNLNGIANGALRSIEKDLAESTGRMRGWLMRVWVQPLVVGLSLFLGISGGSWATMHWLSAAVESRARTVGLLDFEIEQARETLAQMEDTTWGVTLAEIDGERFVVLPAGTLENPPWSVGGKPAVKLSSE